MILFRKNFADAKFRELKPSQNGEITKSFTDEDRSCPSWEFLGWQVCLLTLFAKTSEFTVTQTW